MRTQPHSLEAEIAVVGGVLLHPDSYQRTAAFVAADDFYHPAHKAIWQGITEADRRREPIDPVTVGRMLQMLGITDHLRAFGGLDYLTDLMGQVVTVENIEHHARIVARKASRRRLAAALAEQVTRAFDEHIDDEEFMTGVDELVLRAQAEGRLEKSVPLREVLRETLRRIGERYERRKDGISDLPGISTKIPKLDLLTGGLFPGQQVVLAARPAVGKSALAKDIAIGAASDGVPVFIYSAEMTNEQTAVRMLAGAGNVNTMAIRHGKLDEQAWVRLHAAATKLADLPIHLDDDAATIAEVKARVRRWRATAAKGSDLALVIVDYLQLLKTAEKRGGRQFNREQEVAEISRSLKLLAKQARCAVISLSQLSRKVEERADKRPMLSDLRESGSLEQDADIVAFLYRDEVYDTDDDNPHKGTAELIVEKHRDGATATVWLRWDGAHTTFSPLDQPPPPKPKGRRGSASAAPPPDHWQDAGGFE